MILWEYKHFNRLTKRIKKGEDFKKSYVWSEVSPGEDYNVVTDLIVIDSNVKSARDYKVGRDYIKSVILNKAETEELAFDTLSTIEKQIASIHKVGLEVQRMNSLSIDVHNDAMVFYLKNTNEVRQIRSAYAETLIRNELNALDRLQVMGISGEVFSNYLKFGIEGSDSGDPIGITDYLKAKQGTPFAQIGLRVSNYQPVNLTVEELADKVVRILTLGDY